MAEGKRSLLDHLLLDFWILVGLLILLAACWWAMPFNIVPGLRLAIPEHLSQAPASIANYGDWSLGAKLGFWIASKGWDSGPPPEYPYDFILFWHLSLSALAYLGIFWRLQALPRRHAESFRQSVQLPVRTTRMLFLYPILSWLITMVVPWDDTDVGAHRMFCFMVYIPLFCSLSLLTLGSDGKRLPHLLIGMVCLLVATLAFVDPIHGHGVGIMIILGVSLAVSIWSLAVWIWGKDWIKAEARKGLHGRHSALFLAFLFLSLKVSAYPFAPGINTGIPAFDRWDTCLWVNGGFVDYIAAKEKEKLRSYAGQFVQIDVTKYYQIANPGVTLIQSFTHPMPMPPSADAVKLKGLKITTRLSSATQENLEAFIICHNTGADAQIMSSERIVPVLMRKRKTATEGALINSDGPSYAALSEQALWIRGDKPGWEGHGRIDSKQCSWRIGPQTVVPAIFKLNPGESREIPIRFEIPEGEYDFFCGYGALISNFTAFDVTPEGKAKPCNVKHK